MNNSSLPPNNHQVNTPSNARAALWYARHGWPIFPLWPNTKQPLTKNGVYAATTDIDQITDWWRDTPNANIGLHVGGAGLLALDLDSYKDTFGGAGFLSPADENTVTSLTAGGGTHLLFALPDGVKFGNSKGNLPPGIDVKSHGGYIVVPPSTVRYVGADAAKHNVPDGYIGHYRWEIGYGPHELTPAPLPHPLRAILEDAHKQSKPLGPPDAIAVKHSEERVKTIADALDLDLGDARAYEKDGRVWTLKTCPFNPAADPHADDKAAYILIRQDGVIRAGCLHERCRDVLTARHKTGWGALLQDAEDKTRTGTAGGSADRLLAAALRNTPRFGVDRTAVWLAAELKREGLAIWAINSVLTDYAHQARGAA